MVNLWQFFGLPDPEGNPPPRPRAAASPPPDDEERPTPTPSTSTAPSSDEPSSDEPQSTQAPQNSTSAEFEPSALTSESTRITRAPEGWSGPVTPDGEPFHDLGVVHPRPAQHPTKALRYIAPDEMKRIPTRAMLRRVIEGDTAIVDLRSLVHMESHQMACRREIKHMADEARVSVFSLDAEDKLLMIPGLNVVVDMQKHELGLTPLLSH